MTAFFAFLAFVFGSLALLFTGLLVAGAASYIQKRRELEAAQKEIEQVKQQAKKGLARYQAIADLEKYKMDLETKVNSARLLLPRLQNLAEMEHHREKLSKNLMELNRADARRRERISSHERALASLVAQAQCVEETLVMQSFGLYKPMYGFDDSEHYEHKLLTIRDAQTALVKSEGATHCPQQWTVDGSVAKGRKMVNEQAKLMLRAFNGECDAAIAKVKYNNVNNLVPRVQTAMV